MVILVWWFWMLCGTLWSLETLYLCKIVYAQFGFMLALRILNLCSIYINMRPFFSFVCVWIKFKFLGLSQTWFYLYYYLRGFPCLQWTFHYKKMGFRPRLKNTAIDPKNAAIGYSCVYKCGLNTVAIGL